MSSPVPSWFAAGLILPSFTAFAQSTLLPKASFGRSLSFSAMPLALGVPYEWHLSHSLTPKDVLPSWQLPQNLPAAMSDCFISVVRPLKAKPRSVWHALQEYFDLCVQWVKTTGFTSFESLVALSMTTLP